MFVFLLVSDVFQLTLHELVIFGALLALEPGTLFRAYRKCGGQGRALRPSHDTRGGRECERLPHGGHFQQQTKGGVRAFQDNPRQVTLQK